MNKNSALIWLPAIEAARLPVPKTVVVPYNHRECALVFDGEPSTEFDQLVKAVGEAAVQISRPVFIRTDLSSAKHSGPTAYRIRRGDEPGRAVLATLEDNEMKFWLERDQPAAFLVRQFLELDASFTAFCDFPVAREFRFFADSERVHCFHPYWPAETLEDHMPSRDDWRERLADLHKAPDVPELWDMAIIAAKVCGGGAWSVDFCRDVNGKWWLLDMATAEDSYHWPGCPNGAKNA